MGAGASSSDHLTEREQKFFEEMQRAYEDEYKPQIAEQKLQKSESVKFFKSKINSFVEGESKKDSFEDESKTDDVLTEMKADAKRSPEKAKPHKSKRRSISRAPSSVEDAPKYYVGDIVKAKVDGMMFEGVVMLYGEDDDTIDVDFGDDIETVRASDCTLVMSGLDFEVGDYVQARTIDSAMYCHGKIIKIHLDGSFDILFDGDDEDDIEKNVPHEFVRKHRTGRDLARKRWNKARTMLSSVKAFSSSVMK